MIDLPNTYIEWAIYPLDYAQYDGTYFRDYAERKVPKYR